MKIAQIKLRLLKMNLNFNFKTSSGVINDKELILVEVNDDDNNQGWGETVAFTTPFYTEETVKTNWHLLEDILIPLTLGKKINHPTDLMKIFSTIKRNNMAKAALECAIWDLYAKRTKLPLATALGGKKDKIDVGISIGIQNSIAELLDEIDHAINNGYKRVKIKIEPGWDVNVFNAVRERYPDLPLMADANSAYRLDQIDLLKQLDHFNLLMIEQPLGADDIIDHSIAQKQLQTPLCLDESIHTYEDARLAIELGSCKIINLKFGRVGGLFETKRIHDLCAQNNIDVWCGGMLEAGVGRAHSIAISSLKNFTLPGDTAASSRYWKKDIITPEVTVENGQITIPESFGIGYEVDEEAVKYFTIFEKTFAI